MSTGPITLFDKSIIHLLSFDEAALFGQFYRVNLTPMFFVETLADLTKEKGLREGQTPEQLVEQIAAKTANMTFDPTVHHDVLVIGDLLGRRVKMDGRPHMAGGRSVQTKGTKGVIFKGSPETEAFYRWQRGRFFDIERDMAKGWRDALQSQKLDKLSADLFGGEKPKTLADVKALADKIVRRRVGPHFVACLNILNIPSRHRGAVLARWLASGAPPIADFAPYAAYVATVLLFFQLAVAADLISGERPSHSADIAYLFYLPFCMVFASNDKLHMQTVPLFMRANQVFLPGGDLKAELRRLDEHFSVLPQEVRDRGLRSFEPPLEGDYLTTRLWRRFLLNWHPERPKQPREPKTDAAILEMFKAQRAAQDGPPVGVDDADFVIVERQYPYTMGKYRIFPPEVEERERARRAAEREAAAAPTASAVAVDEADGDKPGDKGIPE